MWDRWVNIGQSAEMTRYIEPPWTELDPPGNPNHADTGYKKEEIEESLTENKFNNIMGTYRILNMKLNIGSRKIKVRPCSSSDPNMRLSTTQGIWASGKNGRDPGTPPPSTESNVPTLISSSEWSSTTSSGNLQGRTIIPRGSLEWRTTTPQAAPPHHQVA